MGFLSSPPLSEDDVEGTHENILKAADSSLHKVDYLLDEPLKKENVVSTDWLEGFSKSVDAFKDWNDKIDNLQQELVDLDHARQRISSSLGEQKKSFTEVPVQPEVPSAAIAESVIQEPIEQHDPYKLESSKTEAYKPMVSYDIIPEDINEKLRKYTQAKEIVEKERELAHREEDILLRERLLEQKYMIIAQGIASAKDPRVLEVVALLDAKVREVNAAKSQIEFQYQMIQRKESAFQQRQAGLEKERMALEQYQAQVQQGIHGLLQEQHKLEHEVAVLKDTKSRHESAVRAKQQEVKDLIAKEESWLRAKEQLFKDIAQKSAVLQEKERQLEENIRKAKDQVESYRKREEELQRSYDRKQKELHEWWTEKNKTFESLLRSKSEELQKKESEMTLMRSTLDREIQELRTQKDVLREQSQLNADKQRSLREMESQLAAKLSKVDAQIQQMEEHKRDLEKTATQVAARIETEMQAKMHAFKSDKERLLQKEKMLVDKLSQIEKKEKDLQELRTTLSRKEQDIISKEKSIGDKEQAIVRQEATMGEHIANLERMQKVLHRKIAAKATDEPSKQSVARDRIAMIVEMAEKSITYDREKAKELYRTLREIYATLSEQEKKEVHSMIMKLFKALQEGGIYAA